MGALTTLPTSHLTPQLTLRMWLEGHRRQQFRCDRIWGFAATKKNPKQFTHLG